MARRGLRYLYVAGVLDLVRAQVGKGGGREVGVVAEAERARVAVNDIRQPARRAKPAASRAMCPLASSPYTGPFLPAIDDHGQAGFLPPQTADEPLAHAPTL